MAKMKIIAVFVAAVAVLSLTGCGGSREIQESENTTIEYKGNPLDCVTWDGSHGERGLSCDFVEYHERFGYPE